MKKLIVAALLTAFAMTVVAAPVLDDKDKPTETKKKGKKKKAEDKPKLTF